MKFATKLFSPRDLFLLALAAGLVLIYVAAASGGFPLDDSWIHQVYGRNLGQSGQWAFVPGVPSAASTSPLYTVLLAIGYSLNIPFKLWTHGLGVLALWMTGVIGARWADLLLPAQKYSGILAGMLLILAWHLLWAAASGMETMLFSMWTLVLMFLARREFDPPSRQGEYKPVIWRALRFGVLAALASLTRPEGVVLVGLIGLTFLFLRPQRSWGTFLLWSVCASATFILVMLPYLALNLRLTGGLLPDTAAAKQAEYISLLNASWLTRFGEMLQPLIAGAQLFLIPGMVYALIWLIQKTRQNRAALFDLLPIVWAVALIGLYAARLPAPYQHGRYVIPALPSLILIGVVGTVLLVNLAQKSMLGRVLTRTLALSAVLGFAGFALFIGTNQYRTDVTIIDEEMVASARWIAEHIPPDEQLALHDIGALGYFAPRPLLDLAGLVSPEIVPFINDADRLWSWLYQNNARYLMAFPNQIPGKDTADYRLCLLFSSGGSATKKAGEANMAVYALAWDGVCPQP